MTTEPTGTSTSNPRRNKPVHFGAHHNVRLGADEEASVEAMRTALAKQRGVPVKKVNFSEALRLLLGENLRAARVLASTPGALPQPETIDLPAEFWDGLTECRNRLKHAQGSMYGILRNANVEKILPTVDDFRESFEQVQEGLAAIDRLEALGVALVTTSAGADAEADTQAA